MKIRTLFHSSLTCFILYLVSWKSFLNKLSPNKPSLIFSPTENESHRRATSQDVGVIEEGNHQGPSNRKSRVIKEPEVEIPESVKGEIIQIWFAEMQDTSESFLTTFSYYELSPPEIKFQENGRKVAIKVWIFQILAILAINLILDVFFWWSLPINIIYYKYFVLGAAWFPGVFWKEKLNPWVRSKFRTCLNSLCHTSLENIRTILSCYEPFSA